MTTQPTDDLQYSWSLDLREVLLQDDFATSWLSMTTDLLISTGTGSAEGNQEGPTAVYFIEVPSRCLVSAAEESDLVVLEVTRADDVTLAHLRPAWVGAEPVRDIAMAEAES